MCLLKSDCLIVFQEGFHLRSLGDNSFSCQKLGQIVVTINPGEGAEEVLPSVLLSLSGDDGYRKNAATIPGGVFSFTYLFPGSFYLRPLLKVQSLPSSPFHRLLAKSDDQY